jgi:hypothetical protein
MEANAGPAEDGGGVTAVNVQQQLDRAVAEVRAPLAAALTQRMSECGLGGLGGVVSPRREKEEEGGDRDSGGGEAPETSSSAAPAFHKMVILGLGSPSNSSTSRLQLALALVLAEHLSLPVSAVELYDPVFTPIDGQVLAERGLKVIERAESDKYAGGGAPPTVGGCTAVACSRPTALESGAR